MYMQLCVRQQDCGGGTRTQTRGIPRGVRGVGTEGALSTGTGHVGADSAHANVQRLIPVFSLSGSSVSNGHYANRISRFGTYACSYKNAAPMCVSLKAHKKAAENGTAQRRTIK
jgi:hypothetical protein